MDFTLHAYFSVMTITSWLYITSFPCYRCQDTPGHPYPPSMRQREATATHLTARGPTFLKQLDENNPCCIIDIFRTTKLRTGQRGLGWANREVIVRHLVWLPSLLGRTRTPPEGLDYGSRYVTVPQITTLQHLSISLCPANGKPLSGWHDYDDIQPPNLDT